MKTGNCIFLVVIAGLLTSCATFNKIYKSPDIDFKYEAAKQYFFKGKQGNVSMLLEAVMPGMKGTEKGDEATFVAAMSAYRQGDYINASDMFKKYTSNYPAGVFNDAARFHAAASHYMSVPQIELDQTETTLAISELQNYIEIDPQSAFAPKAWSMVHELNGMLIQKEYMSAKLYYNLGGYIGNCTMGGNNYEACIVTAQNAIRDYPTATKEMKEELSIMILRAKYHLALQSTKEKYKERLENTIDEYYGFTNEFPESQYSKEAKDVFEKTQKLYKAI